MIDWYSVSFSALWITGLGLVTAGWSLANYLGSRQNRRFMQTLITSPCRIMIGLGLVFFCVGLAGSVSTAWEHILWAALALIFVLQTWLIQNKSNL